MPRRMPKLHLKLRVRVTERMTKREMLRRLRRTVETGTMQEGIEVAWLDWQTGEGRRARGGVYKLDAAVHAALTQFYRAIVSPGWRGRVEVVDQ